VHGGGRGAPRHGAAVGWLGFCSIRSCGSFIQFGWSVSSCPAIARSSEIDIFWISCIRWREGFHVSSIVGPILLLLVCLQLSIHLYDAAQDYSSKSN